LRQNARLKIEISEFFWKKREEDGIREGMEETIKMLDEGWDFLQHRGWISFVLSVLLGVVLTLVVSRVFRMVHRKGHYPEQVLGLLRKVAMGVLWALVTIQALHAVGVDLLGVLGAAGVVGVAVGFASQTALSNLISGVFLISERSIKLGDYIRVNGQEGKVEEVNLLSVSLRQLDNSLVRVPCELMIKNPVVNVTHEHKRRCDYALGVDYSSDLKQVRQVILQVAAADELILKEPAPVVTFADFGDCSLDLKVGVWCRNEDYVEVRYRFAHALLAAFGREGINIPFPVRQVLLQEQKEASEVKG